MIKKVLLFCLTMIMFSNILLSQNTRNFPLKVADSLYNKCLFNEALLTYQSFLTKSNNKNTFILGKIAICCIQLNYPNDSAFHYLIDYGKEAVSHFFIADPAFEKIESDVRWNVYLDLIREKYTVQADSVGLGYRLLLTTITDQRNRKLLSNRCGNDLIDKKELWKKINVNDSINLNFLLDVVSKYGWPSITMVGYWPSNAAFMILQHSPIEYQEKYLRVIDSLAKVGEVEILNYVYLADRVMAIKDGVQLYGTQYNSKGLVPILDPENFNIRRIKLKIDPYTNEELNMIGIDSNMVNK